MTAEASALSDGMSQRKSSVAANAPASWAATNPATSAGLIPANVLLTDRASVTAGLAKDVDAVNQYAAVIYAPTAKGTAAGLCLRHPQITESSPKVAMNSLKSWAAPERTCVDAKKRGRPNMRCAAATPANAPATCA